MQGIFKSDTSLTCKKSLSATLRRPRANKQHSVAYSISCECGTYISRGNREIDVRKDKTTHQTQTVSTEISFNYTPDLD